MSEEKKEEKQTKRKKISKSAQRNADVTIVSNEADSAPQSKPFYPRHNPQNTR